MRKRILNPTLFDNEILGTIDPLHTILFEGLWCMADREGLLELRPQKIKARIFPYRNISVGDTDVITCSDNGQPLANQCNDMFVLLRNLELHRFICTYEVDFRQYIHIRSFKTEQHIHPHEARSILPAIPDVSGASCLRNAFVMTCVANVSECQCTSTSTSTSTYGPAPAGASESATPRCAPLRERKKRPPLPEPSADALSLADLLRERVLANYPSEVAGIPERWKKIRDEWARDIDLALTRDRRQPQWIRSAIEFGCAHTFWKKNIRSGRGLRKHYGAIVAEDLFVVETEEKHHAK